MLALEQRIKTMTQQIYEHDDKQDIEQIYEKKEECHSLFNQRWALQEEPLEGVSGAGLKVNL